MTPEHSTPNNGHPHPNGDIPQPDQTISSPPGLAEEPEYEPGETLSRGMNIACSLVLLFFALLSCGFIVSVLSSHH